MTVDHVRAWRIAFFLLLFLGIGLTQSGRLIVREIALIGIAILVAANMVITLLFWRCPHCRKLLPVRNSLRMEYCPRCGQPL